jgi:hypothetical protein
MKAAKNTAEILLDKTVSILPILNARYNLCGGRTVKWKTPAKIKKTSCNMMSCDTAWIERVKTIRAP